MRSGVAACAAVLWLAGAMPAAQAQEAQQPQRGGFLRERIKQRMLEKEQAKPAPETSGDVHARIDKPGDYAFSFEHGGLKRMYKVHVPAKYDPSKPAPLLVALHGGGGDMEVQSTDRFYRQISKSDELGFVVVFPNGYSKFQSGKLATWNAGRCCAGARDNHVDDVGFVKQMIDNVEHQLNIDRRRVYATGMSNGGMMTYQLACSLPGTFRAIASVAGTDNTNGCTSPQPVSVLHIHAQNDDHVLFNGGAGGFRDESQVTNFTSVPKTIEKWTAVDHCSAPPKRVLDTAGAHCDQYASCENGTKVQLCVTETGKHSWPGGEKPRGGTEPPSQALSANDVMWNFFQSLN
jgi:polyhydroxybutyrate depolymerase